MADQLADYIRNALGKGYQEAELRTLLRAEGWKDQDLDRAFAEVRTISTPARTIIPAPAASGSGSVDMIDFPALFRRSFDLWLDRLATLLCIRLFQFAMMLPLGILLLVAIAAAGFSLFGVSHHGAALLGGFVVIVVLLIMIVVALITSAWSSAASVFALKDSRERIGVIESFRRGWPRMPVMLLAIILVTLCVLGGLLLFVVPGIIFAIWFSFTMIIVVVENRPAVAAMSRSKELVNGYSWEIFLRFLVLFILTMVVFIVPAGFMSVAAAMTPFPASLLLNLFSLIIQMALSLLFSPFWYVYLYTLYLDLRRIKG